MGRSSNTIKENITQFILIVFSVVLGLYLSERIEESKEIQASEDLLATIKSEVKDNFMLLEKWYPYHREISENLEHLSKDEVFIQSFINDKSSLFESLLTKGTFMGRTPVSDAWDIAKSHPLIVKIDYDKYLILSRIYNQQELTFVPLMEVFELFNAKDLNTEENAKQNLELISNQIRELVAREEQLLEYYKTGKGILDLSDDG